MSPKPTNSMLETLRRLLAAGSAVLVLVLGLMAVSPTLHSWVHSSPADPAADHSHPSSPMAVDHDCAVVGFSHGLTLALDTALPAAVPVVWHEVTFSPESESGFTPARYARPPGRAPPLV